MYNKLIIKINTIEKAKDFIRISSTIAADLDIKVGRYIIDAKSIMGIYSIDLSRDVELIIHSTDEAECNTIKEKFRQFIIGE